VEVQSHIFPTTSLDKCERTVSRSDSFIPGKGAIGTHWLGGWAVPRADMVTVTKRRILSENLEGRYRRRWEDNIKMGLRETGWEVWDWIHLIQDTESGRLL